jgi:uncharacterized FlaG/YvyC family protein
MIEQPQNPTLPTHGVSYRYLIQVISKQSNQVIHEIPCKSYIGADRVQDGVELNMNHELYYTKLVTL